MKPSQVAIALLHIASGIQASKNPDKNLVARDLKKIISILRQAGNSAEGIEIDLEQQNPDGTLKFNVYGDRGGNKIKGKLILFPDGEGGYDHVEWNNLPPFWDVSKEDPEGLFQEILDVAADKSTESIAKLPKYVYDGHSFNQCESFTDCPHHSDDYNEMVQVEKDFHSRNYKS